MIVSDLPALREVLDDEVSLFAPPGDTDSWVRAIMTLRDDESLRERLGARARSLSFPDTPGQLARIACSKAFSRQPTTCPRTTFLQCLVHPLWYRTVAHGAQYHQEPRQARY